ncbi:apolipoprotein D-like [Babylonia areolata]|uniref:apolipoprotein D-like n=1 Tax=Babylonia areolata TaxID=304850 RepID=UPI003FD33E30
MMLKLIVLSACVMAAMAQSPSFGGCPTVPAQTTFDLNRYLGYWYEIYVFPTHFEKGKCTRAKYSLKDDGHIEVYNRGLENGTEVRAVGDAYCPNTDHPANLLVRFAAGTPYGKYNVIDTDYDTYTLIYSCESILGVAHIEFAWILARERQINQTLTDRLMNELKGYGVDVTKFKKSDQEGCPA